MKAPKIPSVVSFPGGYRVSIRTLSPRGYAQKSRWLKFSGETYAFFYEEEGGNASIFLRSDRNYGDRWRDLAHELDHAMNEWRNWVDSHVVGPFYEALAEEAADDLES